RPGSRKPNDDWEAYTGRFAGRKRESHLAKSNSAPKRYFNVQVGTPSHQRNPTPRRTLQVSSSETCRGRRAWHAKQEPHGNWDALPSPPTPTAGVRRAGRVNDKKNRPAACRESDRSVVVWGQASAAPTRNKGPAERRNLQRKPAP